MCAYVEAIQETAFETFTPLHEGHKQLPYVACSLRESMYSNLVSISFTQKFLPFKYFRES